MLTKPSSCSGCPLSCMPFGGMHGYVPAEKHGTSGVLIVLEAAGEDEALAGRPTVGKAGQYLFQQLKRVGLERSMFSIHNVLSCQPPGNKLAGMPYETAAIQHCAPNLDQTIKEHVEHCKANSLHPTILSLGKTAFKRLMGVGDEHPMVRADYNCYPHWLDNYGCWLFAADHPSYLMRGNHHLAPTLWFAAERAIEVAKNGLVLDNPTYLQDPNYVTFANWVECFKVAYAKDRSLVLSYDIETPMKSGADEEKVAREDDDDYTILRISFSYRPGEAVSVPWSPEYLPFIQELFNVPCDKLGWNLNYDRPRVLHAGMTIAGRELDAMLAWHVLNSAMPKGLGFVTPFFVQNTAMWKHLSDAEPAFYNAKDADMALRNFIGIRDSLIANDQWHVFENHVIKLNEVLTYMSRKGVPLDEQARRDGEARLAAILAGVEADISKAVPLEAQQLKVYKAAPKALKGLDGDELTEAAKSHGLIQVPGVARVKRCPSCGETGVTAAHFKSIGKKRLKQGDPENPCFGESAVKADVPATLWAKPLEWLVSKKGLERYQAVRGHKPVFNRKEAKVTFDENAMKTLISRYPNDPLYPLIGRQREVSKLLSTYVGVTDPDTGRVRGGMPVGRDGNIHTTYTHNPSTLRLASQQPNLQNLPRPSKDPNALQNIIRNLVVAPPGTIFVARDFSGIEAVLVGYEARTPEYIRLAKMDVHSFYTAYAIHALDGRIRANELPELSWDDDKLARRLGEIKKEFGHDRNSLYKHLTHAINFGQGPKGAQEKIYKETDRIFDVKIIARVMDVYKELFPAIPKWHRDIQLQAHHDGYLRNAFGYVHRFSRVFAHKLVDGVWVKDQGEDASAVLAFRPQSNAAGIIKEAILRLFFNRFEEGGHTLRLQVHDEIFCHCDEQDAERIDLLLKEEMERPVPELPLPASWGMGSHLVILTEGKSGTKWGTMH